MNGLDGAAALLSASRCAVALTGAGVSTESGVPDFRSPGGLWERFDPMEYATLACFEQDPAKAWRLYRALGESLADCRPNAAHVALAQLEGAGRLAGVVTQNIDGLHQAAGSSRVLEIHGSWRALECSRCRRSMPLIPNEIASDEVPRCPGCRGPLKPAVVLFGEDVRAIDDIDELLAKCDLMLVVGTSAEVAPASWLPGSVRVRGGRIVEFNLQPCVGADVFVPGRAGTTLPALARAVLGGPPVTR